MLNKKFIATALALATAAGLLATEISEAVLARVGTDTVITSYDVRVQAAQLESKLPPKMDSRKRMEAVAEIRSNVLDEMIVTELVWLDFQSLRGKIPMDIVQSRIDRLIQSEAGSDEDRFRDMLHRENMTYNEFVEKVKKQLAVEMLLYDRTRRNIFVTDKQIDEYFALHRPEFTTNVRHHLLAILLPQEGDWRETFDTLKARIRAGEDFASLAKAFSKGANAEEGGDLGWMESMNPALAKAVDSLKVGECNEEPVLVGSNAYLVKLVGKEGGELPELTPELRQRIKKAIENEISVERLEEYKKTLMTKYPVRKY